MEKTSNPPSPVLTNAILVPSGDQAGSKSNDPAAEIRGSSLPSAPIIQNSYSLVDAICVPSGDQVGRLIAPESFVRLCRSVPSAFMSQTSLGPQLQPASGYRTQAIRVPS